MGLDILQVAALAAHGNKYLASGEERPHELRLTNPAFKVAKSIDFERRGQGSLSRLYEESSSFLRVMRAEGVPQFRPFFANTTPSHTRQPDETIFGLLVDGERGLELWRPTWRAKMEDGRDTSPWLVTYLAERFSRHALEEPPTPEEAAAQLENALKLTGSIYGYGAESDKDIEDMFSFWSARETHMEDYEGFLPNPCYPKAAQLLATGAVITKATAKLSWKGIAAQNGEFDKARRALWRAAMSALECGALHANEKAEAELSSDQSAPDPSQAA